LLPLHPGLPSGAILLGAGFAKQTNGLVWGTGSSSLPGPPGAGLSYTLYQADAYR